MRLIDADALIEDLRKDRESVYSHVFGHVACDSAEELAVDLEQTINNQPTIDSVPVVHGEWEFDISGVGHYYCSVCGGRGDFYGKYNFCPNCGAKMDGGAE